jgi:hypothetical protein
MPIVLDLLGLVGFILLSIVFAVGLIWLLTILIYRLNRRNVFRTAQAVAEKLRLHWATLSDQKDVLSFQGQIGEVPVFLFTHARYDKTQPGSRQPIVAFQAVPMLLFVATFPQPLLVSLEIAAGRMIEPSMTTGDLQFDVTYKIKADAQEWVRALLKPDEVKKALAKITRTGILPYLDQDQVIVIFSIFNSEKIVQAACDAIEVAEILSERQKEIQISLT